MDINSLFSIFVICLPLIYAIYLIIAKVNYFLVSKNLLKNGLISIGIFQFLAFLYLTYLTYFNDLNIEKSASIIDFKNIILSVGLNINKTNVVFLLSLSLFYLFILKFARKFFIEKKQFLFTKQRYNIFLSLLIFNSYFYLVSENLFQLFFAWIIQSFVIYLFTFFDLQKENSRYNISRFYRILLIGDFSFLLALLLLYRYAILSSAYIKSLNISINEFGIFLSYLYGILSSFEYKLIFILLLIAIFTRLAIFPFNCLYSFLANSSNPVFLPIYISANNFLGVYFFLYIVDLRSYIQHFDLILVFFLVINIITSAICLLYEKNVKIFFGYLIAILNSALILCLPMLSDFVYVYFVLLLLILTILYKFFNKNIMNFSKRFIKKNKGFYLEKAHIFLFETLPSKSANLLIVFSECIMQFILYLIKPISNFFIGFIALSSIKASSKALFWRIFIILILFTVILIFMVLFGGSEVVE